MKFDWKFNFSLILAAILDAIAILQSHNTH